MNVLCRMQANPLFKDWVNSSPKAIPDFNQIKAPQFFDGGSYAAGRSQVIFVQVLFGIAN